MLAGLRAVRQRGGPDGRQGPEVHAAVQGDAVDAVDADSLSFGPSKAGGQGAWGPGGRGAHRPLAKFMF